LDGGQCSCDHLKKRAANYSPGEHFDMHVSAIVDFVCSCESGKNNGENLHYRKWIPFKKGWGDDEALFVEYSFSCNNGKVTAQSQFGFYD